MLKYQTLADMACQRIAVGSFKQAIDSVARRPV
jgi:hypothetical protein